MDVHLLNHWYLLGHFRYLRVFLQISTWNSNTCFFFSFIFANICTYVSINILKYNTSFKTFLDIIYMYIFLYHKKLLFLHTTYNGVMENIQIICYKTYTKLLHVVLGVLLFCAFCTVLSVCFCTGHFVMVPLNLTYLHCLKHFFLNISSIYCIFIQMSYWGV